MIWRGAVELPAADGVKRVTLELTTIPFRTER